MQSRPRLESVVAAWLVAAAMLLLEGEVAGQGPAVVTVKKSLADLAWLAGRWQTAAGGRMQVEEHWMAPAGGTMIGMGRTIAGERTVEFEYLRLEQRGDEVYYVAHPKARSPGTDFRLTRLTADEAIFANPQHDFPKRIRYRKNGDGSLTASIDGGEGTRTITFAYLPMLK